VTSRSHPARADQCRRRGNAVECDERNLPQPRSNWEPADDVAAVTIVASGFTRSKIFLSGNERLFTATGGDKTAAWRSCCGAWPAMNTGGALPRWIAPVPGDGRRKELIAALSVLDTFGRAPGRRRLLQAWVRLGQARHPTADAGDLRGAGTYKRRGSTRNQACISLVRDIGDDEIVGSVIPPVPSSGWPHREHR
jgi:hypothetical protein